MTKKQELFKNTIIIFIGKLCTQFITILLLPLYTKYLVSSEYGIVDLVTTYISLFVPVLSLELEMATFRFLVDNRNDKNKLSEIISTVLKALVVIAFLSTVIYMFISLFLNIKYKYLISLVILICFFSQFFLQVARGLGKTINYSISCCITGILTVLLNILLIIVFAFEADGIFISMIIANIITIIYLFVSLNLFSYFKFKVFNKKLLKTLLKYSIPLVPNGISWWIVNASDRTIISIVLDISANGIYAVSNKFSSLFIGIFNVFQLSWTESASLHINDKENEKFFSSTINFVLKTFICLALLMISAMPIIFNLFIDKKYSYAYYNVPILIIAMIFNVVVGLYSALYIAKKMTKQVMYTSIVSAIINILINLILIKYIGLYAASISTLLAYAVMAIYRHLDFNKIIRISIDRKMILIGIISFVFVCFCYYQKHTIYTILMIIYSVIYLLFNFKKILQVVPSFIKKQKTKKE